MKHPPVLVGTKSGFHAIGTSAPPIEAAIDHAVLTAGGVWFVADARRLEYSGSARASAELTEARANCLLVLDGGRRVLIGAADAALFELRGSDLGRVRTFDAAPGRDSWYTPWGGAPDVRSMAQGVEGNIYVNVHVGGVVRSTDDALTWTDTIDIDADVHQVVDDPTLAGRAYAATAWGLAATTSGGDRWHFIDTGLHGTYCRAVAVSETSVFVSASLGSAGRQAALYRMEHDADSFERCTAGLPDWFSTNLDTFCLAARDKFVVAADRAGVVYTSVDDGRTWSVAATGLAEIRCVAIG